MLVKDYILCWVDNTSWPSLLIIYSVSIERIGPLKIDINPHETMSALPTLWSYAVICVVAVYTLKGRYVLALITK